MNETRFKSEYFANPKHAFAAGMIMGQLQKEFLTDFIDDQDGDHMNSFKVLIGDDLYLVTVDPY